MGIRASMPTPLSLERDKELLKQLELMNRKETDHLEAINDTDRDDSIPESKRAQIAANEENYLENMSINSFTALKVSLKIKARVVI